MKAEPLPVTVVSGLPRSGTSMMMQMLEAGGMRVLTDATRRADDDNPRGYYEFEPVKRIGRDGSWLNDAAGAAVKMVYLLLYDLPSTHRYRVLFMRRPVVEVVRSQQVMLQRRTEQGAGLKSREMAEVFARELQRVEDWLTQQSHMDVLHVDYGEVMTGALGQARCIREFLDRDLDPAAMAAVVDVSLYRQRGT